MRTMGCRWRRRDEPGCRSTCPVRPCIRGADILSPSGYHIYNHCVSMNALKCDSFLVPRSRCSQMPIELERNLQVSTPAELLAGWRVASRLGYSLAPCCGSTREPAPTGFRHQTATTTIPRETRWRGEVHGCWCKPSTNIIIICVWVIVRVCC